MKIRSSILGLFAALTGAASAKAPPQPGKSIIPATCPNISSYRYPSHQPAHYTTTGTRKAMRAAKKRRAIKAKQPK